MSLFSQFYFFTDYLCKVDKGNNYRYCECLYSLLNEVVTIENFHKIIKDLILCLIILSQKFGFFQ